MKSIHPFLLILFLSGLFSCRSPVEPSGESTTVEGASTIVLTEDQRDFAGIETGRIRKELVADIIDCTGYIDVPPTNKVTLHAPINGRIQHIDAVEGRKVKAKQELFIIADQEIAELKEEYLDQKLNLSYWETELNRKEKLYKQEAISKKEFLNTLNTYEREKYAYQSMREQLSFLGIDEQELLENGINSTISIRTPISGYISEVFVNLGSFVDENKRMVEIINYDHIHLEMFVFANDVGKIEIGQKVRFQLTGSDYSGWGKVYLIGRKVDEENRSVLIHAHIDTEELPLTVGSSFTAEILTKADSVYCLPESAITTEKDISFVYTEESGGFVQTQIETGRTYNGFVEVINFNDVLDKPIVIRGAYYLSD